MITVTVRFFAGHRDIVGCSEAGYTLAEGTTLGQLWEQLTAEYPRLTGYTGRLLFAVNQQFAQPTTVLANGDEVAFIPPVSGGRS
ncbi:molybdopterin converting factor subunit 1 [Chloroflexus sp.]|uniref:molybdopterin converting factor subunit 1 n=1 Tax=Chloroflexus sp. TaxID=1904827 RepID=UPI00404920D4